MFIHATLVARVACYVLRIPDSYDAKIAKICNFWTFWPVIQLINDLFKIQKKVIERSPQRHFFIGEDLYKDNLKR